MKKNKMRIVFMGTPHFAETILQKLVENNYNVVGVVTVADKPAGRGRKIQQSPVKIYAERQKITVLQPLNLKDEDFLKDLKSLNAELQIVVAFRMLPKEVWQMPKLGTFNLHASLLPDYRGAAPINWAIINQERESGVTTFMIDEKIDTGAILLQERLPIETDETAGTLHDKLMYLGANLVLKTVDGLADGNLLPVPQPDVLHPKDAPKIFKDTCRIDWTLEGNKIDSFIRGMTPYPTAWTELVQNEEVMMMKIYRGKFKAESHTEQFRKVIIKDKKMFICIKDGFYIVEELQVSGKKRMSIKDFLNGMQFSLDIFIK